MANPDQLQALRNGPSVWKAWRESNLSVGEEADLRGADLREAQLHGVDLSWADLTSADLRSAGLGEANLSGANLDGANLQEANLRGARLDGANVSRAIFVGANLRMTNLWEAAFYRADLRGAELSAAYLREADLKEADLTGASLEEAQVYVANLDGAVLRGARLERTVFVKTSLAGADLTGCRVHGLSAWNLNLLGTTQRDLVISDYGEPEITVDNLEVAQFLYLLLHNERLRDVIDTITSKVVLILGRFTPGRKPVLDSLRRELRGPTRNYVPVVFDFEKPRNQTTIETVTLLARMARFVIADLSDAKSILQELQAIVPNSPRLSMQPIIVAEQDEPGMFDFLQSFPWVLKVHQYRSQDELLQDLDEKVISPAEAKVVELRGTHP